MVFCVYDASPFFSCAVPALVVKCLWTLLLWLDAGRDFSVRQLENSMLRRNWDEAVRAGEGEAREDRRHSMVLAFKNLDTE